MSERLLTKAKSSAKPNTKLTVLAFLVIASFSLLLFPQTAQAQVGVPQPPPPGDGSAPPPLDPGDTGGAPAVPSGAADGSAGTNFPVGAGSD
ncbi:MAG TPA: hypothetical protein PLI59_21025, partial [Candidatus Obscuribacter sp.]|nr:hypothetical protein [Candidatus Obscuribacter sp.]